MKFDDNVNDYYFAIRAAQQRGDTKEELRLKLALRDYLENWQR